MLSQPDRFQQIGRNLQILQLIQQVIAGLCSKLAF